MAAMCRGTCKTPLDTPTGSATKLPAIFSLPHSWGRMHRRASRPKDRGTIMLQGWIVIAFALGYIGLLFVVASYGDRTRRFGREGGWRHFIYPLSLAIYCTSWTFFGSVGLASRTGFDFLTIYVGPILLVGLCSPLIMRIVRLAKAQNITSIADFIAARYGKAQTVAATVALIAIIGTIPYIALQLKAVSSSLTTILVHIGPASGAIQPVLGDIALYVALAMAIFAVLFGTRHIDATEHQDGLMLAIATESIVKLVAFVGVGVFVTFWMFDGPRVLFAQALERPDTAAVLTRDQARFLAVPALSRTDQSVRRTDRIGRPADVQAGAGRQRHVRPGPTARRAFRPVYDRSLRRRPLGGDRDGDRGIGRARDHGVERHRYAVRAAAARGTDHRARQYRWSAAHRAANGDLRHLVSRLRILSFV